MKSTEEKFTATPDVDQREQVADATTKEKSEVTAGADVDDLDVANSKAFKGDDSDGKVVWTVRTVLAFLSLSWLNVGSQQILYVVGGCLSYIAEDLHATGAEGWLPVANILAVAAVAPFTGYMEDLLGRRVIAISGAVTLCVGCIIFGTSHTFAQALVGMAVAGAGAAVGELTALAGTSDMVPVKHRGLAAAAVTFTIIPFAPNVLYAQLYASHSTWRWGAWIALIINGIVTVGLIFTYFPKAHPRTQGQSKRQIIKDIDYIGGLLSITGLTLLLVALQAGGYSHPWSSAYVLCTLLIGFALIVGFVVWEWKGAKYPMVPRELFAGQRVVALAYGVAFIGGASFYSLLNMYPLTFSTVYDPAPVKVGTKAVGVAVCNIAGAVFFNAMLSVTKGHAREILFIASAIMTALDGALAVATPFNATTTVAIGSLAGLGVGGILVPAATVAMIVVPDSLLGTAVALSLSVRTVGGSIGYSIYYNVFSNKLKTRLPANIARYAIEAGLPVADAEAFVGTFLTKPAEIAKVPGVNATIIEAATIGSRWAFAESLRYVWYTSIAFGSVACVLSLFIPSIRKYCTNRIAVQV
ncbi:uncharacterized protein PV06_10339 [Exophiala oligosperma]|uniref:Major facilitator superfamily (MFS) profile domain-containing protein n=1 Tax=Exophiala oligosperma TaxID=215243 RepID=A0A0D2D322_9EURO|nr:uncharacterized protein PV06_10339 [Exophiala oligosperma]KIW37708.1 hypothetical protein PV06_10339 [Exophiala oligosperma]